MDKAFESQMVVGQSIILALKKGHKSKYFIYNVFSLRNWKQEELIK